MKMLCIKGRQHPAHTGLFSGRVYDVEVAPFCHCRKERSRAFAMGSAFLRNTLMNCSYCGHPHRLHSGDLVPWGQDRFIPFDPSQLDVTVEEANKLYDTTPERETHDA